MVPREELPKAQTILLDIGFGPREREDIDLLCRKTKGLAPFVRAGFSVEPHWSIAHPTSPFKLDVAGLWARARPAVIAGVDVLALSPEDLLLHLCVHMSHKHSLGQGLGPLCDIAETVCRGDMDWAQVAERTREWRAARYVGLTLCLARSMLGAGVPDAVLQQLVPGGLDQRILQTARQSVLRRTGYERWVPLLDEFGARSLRDKVRMSWKRVFLSRDEMAMKYATARDSKHLHFYYALRLKDVILAVGSHVLKRGQLMLQSRGRDRNAALFNWLTRPRPTRPGAANHPRFQIAGLGLAGRKDRGKGRR
jgi:hypothetical protein